MSLGNLTINLMQQMDNPECSYLVGMQIGQFFTFRILIALLVYAVVYKGIDKLIATPIIDKTKKIIKEKLNKKK